MYEIGTISRERALELLSEADGILKDVAGGYWDKEDVVSLIGVSDRIIEQTGVGHALWILSGDTEYKVSLI